MRPLTQLIAVAALGGAALLAPPAMAQNQLPTGSQQTAPAANISDQKLDATAKAMQHVTSLRQSYQQKIADAAPGDKQRLASEGNDALKKAVTDQGLSVDEYNKILTLAQNNPTVRAKLLQRLQLPSEGK
jgi:hypothetical protein